MMQWKARGKPPAIRWKDFSEQFQEFHAGYTYQCTQKIEHFLYKISFFDDSLQVK